jgi:uncharacterized membrane protein YfcA
MLAAVLAFVIGITLGVLGAGGGILTVPLLHYVVGMDARASTSASLLIVGVTAALAAVLSMKNGRVDGRAALAFALPTAVGMIVSRTILLPSLPAEISIPNGGVTFSRDTLILVPFALVMMMAAWRMFKGPAAAIGPTDVGSQPKGFFSNRTTKLVLSGASIGLVSGFVGAGGGFLIVPALHLLLGLSLPSAIGTSLVVIAMNSGIGVASDVSMGVLHREAWPIIGLLTTASVLGMIVGLKVASKLSPGKIRPAFATLMMVMSLVILAKELFP